MDIYKILNDESDELKESYRIFLEYYPHTGFLRLLTTIFSPLKKITAHRPDLAKKKIIFDAANAEKLKRMRPLVGSIDEVLLFASDLSTDRSKQFYQSIKNDLDHVAYPFSFYGYWTLLPKLLCSDLSRTCFQVMAAQALLHYAWILKETEARYLITANEDSWIAPILSKFCKIKNVVNVNVMHGRVYQAKQFYDYSIVFGKESEKAILGLASPKTKVLLHQPAEYAVSPGSDHVQLAKKILYFDQPDFTFLSPEQRTGIFSIFEDLAKNHGFEISVKLHPVQGDYPAGKYPLFKFFKNVSNQELLGKHGIGVAVCSTVGLEVISSGVPIVYVNQDQLLDHFLQIKFLKPSAPTSLAGVRDLLLKLQNETDFRQFYQEQVALLEAEYSVAQQLNPLDKMT
jgi:hypothetical protein